MNRKTLLVLCGILLIRVVLAGVLPLIDPTEGRYAQIAGEMAMSGDWVTPRLWVGGEQVPYVGKPPLFFWSAAMCIRLLGPSELAVRLPAMIATVILLALMFLVLRRANGVEVADAAVLIVATSFLVFFLAATVILDLHLMLFVAGAFFAHQAFVRSAYGESRRRWSLLVFALLAGGFLTKGPVAIVLFVVPVAVWAALHGRWSDLRSHSWLAGLTLFLVIVGPWFVLNEVRNPGSLNYFLINENLLRFLKPGYGDRYGSGHVFPRGSALIMFVIGVMPWAPVAFWLLAKRRFDAVRSAFRDPSSSLQFIGFVWIVLFWSLSRQLLMTYLLPAVPLFAAWLATEMRRFGWPIRRVRGIAVAFTVVWCVVVLAMMPWVATRSTREVLAEAVRVLDARVGPASVVFAGRTPHSAIFYAPDLVMQHKVETVDRSLAEFARGGGDSVLIIRDRDWQGLSRERRSSVSLLADVPGWRVLGSKADGRVTVGRAGFPGLTSQMVE